jgi:phosphate transport system substrate-binding protein
MEQPPMNDEFLDRLRAEPPSRFAAHLKSRLEEMPRQSAPARSSLTLRTMLVALMIGGAAFAVTAISVRGVPPTVLNLFKVERQASDTAASHPDPSRGQMPSPDIADRPVAPRRLTPARTPTQLASESVPDAQGTAAAGSTAQSPIATDDPASVSRPAARDRSRDAPYIVVSQATYPLARSVADDFMSTSRLRTARIERLGDDRALAALCAGNDRQFPDFALTSRRITHAEVQKCERNAASRVYEQFIGRQAIVLAQGIGNPEMKLSSRAIYLALAKRTPRNDDPRSLVPNAVTMWQQVGVTSSFQQIQVFGPPPDSGTGNALIELLVDRGCREFAPLQQMLRNDPDGYSSVCRSLRTDGLYVDQGDNESLIEQRVRISPGSLGVFTYNHFVAHRDGLSAVTIDDIAPSIENIVSRAYPASRALYLYVKQATLRETPGPNPFLTAFQQRTFADFGVVRPAQGEVEFKLLSLEDALP